MGCRDGLVLGLPGPSDWGRFGQGGCAKSRWGRAGDLPQYGAGGPSQLSNISSIHMHSLSLGQGDEGHYAYTQYEASTHALCIPLFSSPHTHCYCHWPSHCCWLQVLGLFLCVCLLGLGQVCCFWCVGRGDWGELYSVRKALMTGPLGGWFKRYSGARLRNIE